MSGAVRLRPSPPWSSTLAAPALIVVVTVALATLVALGLTVVYLLRHLRSLTGTLAEMRDQLQPTLTQLSEDAEVTQAELARVSEAAEQLGRSADGRPGATRPD